MLPGPWVQDNNIVQSVGECKRGSRRQKPPALAGAWGGTQNYQGGLGLPTPPGLNPCATVRWQAPVTNQAKRLLKPDTR